MSRRRLSFLGMVVIVTYIVALGAGCHRMHWSVRSDSYEQRHYHRSYSHGHHDYYRHAPPPPHHDYAPPPPPPCW